MKSRFSTRRLLGTTSAFTLASIATLCSAALNPAAAQISQGIFSGGTTLSSLAFRQVLDCYAGVTVGGDGNSFSPSFTTAAPTPGLLPTTCTAFSTSVEGLYAGVGSGNGQRGFISNDPHQFFSGSPNSAPAFVKTPSANPPFVDSNNANFGTYPYPRVDFAASDAPLPNVAATSLTTVSFGSFTPSTHWQNEYAITAASSTIASYNTAQFGQPVQVPALEVPVAIAVNVSNPSTRVTWNIQSALSPNTQPGGAIQLSAAQLCAIFSDTVSDWHDTSTLIPYLDQNGVQQFQHFYDDNTASGLTPVAYTSKSLPINIVYRIDESGTSFILTNYLANVCPLLDPTGSYNYKKIFTGLGVNGATTPNLPSNNFVKLIQNVLTVKGDDRHDPDDVDADDLGFYGHWIGALGSNHAAIKIGATGERSGRIGYLSPNLTEPYATTVTENIGGSTVTAAAPLSASVQDENLRTQGVYHPGAQSFIAPTPAAADLTFSSLTVPSPTATFTNWNLYDQVYASGTVNGGVNLSGLSIIAIPRRFGAYPITGATYIQLYSCYADSTGTRVPALKNWLAWYFGGSDSGLANYSPSTSNASNPGYDPDVASVIQNTGFNVVGAPWADTILLEYVIPSNAGGETASLAAYSASGSQTDGCIGVTGGAK